MPGAVRLRSESQTETRLTGDSPRSGDYGRSVSDADETDRLVAEILDGSAIGVAAFGVERALVVGFSLLVTTTLGPAAYGYLSVFTRARTILEELLTGIVSGHSRTLPRYERPGQRSVLLVSLAFLVLGWAVFAAAVVGFRRDIVAVTLLEPQHTSALVAFAAGVLPTLLLLYAASVFRAYRRIRQSVVTSRVVRPAATVASVGLAVGVGATRITSVWSAVVVGSAAAAVVVSVVLWRDTPVSDDGSNRTAARDYATYVAGTSAVAVLGAAQRQVVFLLMAVVLSPVAAGVFSLSALLAAIVRWPLKATNRAVSALVAELSDDGDDIEGVYRRTSRLAAFGAAPIVIAVIPFSRELLAVFADSYAGGAAVLAAAVAGQYVATLLGSNGLFLLMTDNERLTALLHAVHVAVVLPVMVVAVLRYGLLGLGGAYSFSLVFNNATESWLLYRLEGVRPFTTGHWILVATVVGATAIGLLVANLLPLVWSALVVAMTTVGATALGYWIALDDRDRRAARAVVSSAAG